MNINLWVSTDETGEWIAQNTVLKNYDYNVKTLIESDANSPKNFYKIPESIKRILYLDAVDIIIEINRKPVLAVEISHEAGTGHNSFQRFSRIVAAAENKIPIAYIYPEAAFIHRSKSDRWDSINPNVFKALEKVMQIHNVPALLFYYPNYYDGDRSKFPPSSKGLIHDDDYLSLPSSKDSEMIDFFAFVDLVVEKELNKQDNLKLINNKLITNRRDKMQEEFIVKGGADRVWSPVSATIEVSTNALLKHLKKFAGNSYQFGELLESRKRTLIYKVDAKLRGDPYPGSLCALDYLVTRIGEQKEDRDKNLVMAWCDIEYDQINDKLIVPGSGKSSINDFLISMNKVRDPDKCLLAYTDYDKLKKKTYFIPRYYMQANHGCKFSKKKELRVYSAFADAIIFYDGCLWDDG